MIIFTQRITKILFLQNICKPKIFLFLFFELPKDRTTYIRVFQVFVAKNELDIYFKVLQKLTFPEKSFQKGLPNFRVLLPGYRKYLDAIGSCR